MTSTKKESFQTHLATHWYIYLFYALIAIFLWTYAVTLVTRDKPKEVVTIWIMTYDIELAEFTEALENNRPEYLKHIRVNFEDRTAPYVDIKYQGIGVDNDIVILPESFVAKGSAAYGYQVLHKEYLESIMPGLEYYTIDDNAYGIKIFDKDDTDDGLIKYTNETDEKENYYLFINKKSLHMGKINNSQYDGGIKVLRMLLGYEPIL